MSFVFVVSVAPLRLFGVGELYLPVFSILGMDVVCNVWRRWDILVVVSLRVSAGGAYLARFGSGLSMVLLCVRCWRHKVCSVWRRWEAGGDTILKYQVPGITFALCETPLAIGVLGAAVLARVSFYQHVCVRYDACISSTPTLFSFFGVFSFF